MQIRFYQQSDIGKVRSNQEDASLVVPEIAQLIFDIAAEPIPLKESLLIVADGMGGANSGEVASNLTIKYLAEFVSKFRPSYTDVGLLLEHGLIHVNNKLKEHVNSNPQDENFGTTCIAVLLSSQLATLAWVGDSRCYVFNKNKGLILLSKDHSYVQKLIDEHKLTVDEENNHPYKNVITQSLGSDHVSPDIVEYNLESNDIFLLCSDGLNTMASFADIEIVMAQHDNIDAIGNALIALAIAGGGADNISIVLAQVSDKIESVIEEVKVMPFQNKQIFKVDKKQVAKERMQVFIFMGSLLLASLAGYGIYNYLTSTNTIAVDRSSDISITDTTVLSNVEKKGLLNIEIDSNSVKGVNTIKDVLAKYIVRVDTYNSFIDAELQKNSLELKLSNHSIRIAAINGSLFQLLVEGFNTKEEAKIFIDELKEKNAIILYTKSKNE